MESQDFMQVKLLRNVNVIVSHGEHNHNKVWLCTSYDWLITRGLSQLEYEHRAHIGRRYRRGLWGMGEHEGYEGTWEHKRGME